MINPTQQARQVLSEAENKLRGLLELAVSEQRYADVAKLAVVADGLLQLVSGAKASAPAGLSAEPISSADDSATELPRESGPILPRHRVANTSSRQPPDVLYPRFERQGDRLIKLAWSKKDRREYEHRAPVDVILRIAELFEGQATTRTPFLMDAMMPFKMASGGVIPSYQAYLALAWFRTFGAVEARGKDGYAVVVSHLRERVEEAWNGLPDALRP